MSEGVITSYENFFGGTGLPPDLAAEMAMTTSIHATFEPDYQHKEGSSQQIQQHPNSRRYHHLHHHTPPSYNNSFTTPCDATLQTINNSTQMNFICNNNSNVGGTVATVHGNGVPAPPPPSSNIFTQIPFVQIHTTDVQPQSAFNSTRFRRNATSNQEEIKAEPIKSENADGVAGKDRINATPTPPAAAVQPRCDIATNNIQSSLETENNTIANNKVADLDGSNGSIEKMTNVTTPENAVGACSTEQNSSLSFPNVHKCQYCAFISLCESGLLQHVETVHQGSFDMCENGWKRVPFECPGCENIFYALTSIEIHLREDHLMNEQDVPELMHAIKKRSQIPQNSVSTNNNVKVPELVVPNESSMNGGAATQRRSRIYLKNVECLREPNRDPIGQQDNLITESLFHFENDDCNTLVNIGSISMEDQDLIGMLTSGESTFHNNHNSNVDTNKSNIDIGVNETPFTTTITATTQELNKPTSQAPKQKISIKSVDVLREPALMRRDYEMQTFGEFMNACNDLNLHISNNNNNNNNSNSSISNNESNNCHIENEQVATNIDGQYNNYTAKNREMLLDSNDDMMGITTSHFEQCHEKPRKPKIYIKNVDILKEPMTFSSTLNAPSITDSSTNIMNFNFMPQTLQQNATSSFLDTVESLNATVPTFNTLGGVGGGGCGMSQLPLGTISDQYLFDSGVSSFLVNSNTSPTNENYVYGKETSTDNFLIDSSRFTDTITPIITEPTPPPVPLQPTLTPPQPPPPPPTSLSVESSSSCMGNVIDSTTNSIMCEAQPSLQSSNTLLTPLANVQKKQKIFIKNVDILKEPQFQEPRGLLHLRTVDELNLMNRKEVENLIAPNLESNQTNTTMIEEDLSDNFQQLNTVNGESLSVANDACNDNNNAIEQISSYESENFKLNEFNAQNSWHDDYDLGEDIRDIITNTLAPNSSATIATAQKIIHDLDTPQMSLISIPDIEELTGTGTRLHVNVSPELETDTEATPTASTAITTAVVIPSPQLSENTHLITFQCDETNAATANAIQETICNIDKGYLAGGSGAIFNATSLNEIQKDTTELLQLPASSQLATNLSPPEMLKQEGLNQAASPHTNEQAHKVSPMLPQKNTNNTTTTTNFDNIPPLTPMSTTTYTTASTMNAKEVAAIAAASSGLPVPPLVPMLPPQIQLPKSIVTTNACTTAVVAAAAPPAERGRIYVANNLLQIPSKSAAASSSLHETTNTITNTNSNPNANSNANSNKEQTSKTPIAVSVMGGTSVRGRPFGANRTGITKQRKQLSGNGSGGAAGLYLKCTVAGCAFRFKKSTTIDYHIKCHTSDSSPQSMACPECKAPFTNWNSLHTHLWRTHKIDMELYSCQLCNFKTPIYSRLLNTHSKIHYDERNYKCDQCEKAFKNTKQLKNHRRWHRNHNKSTAANSARKESTKKDNITTTPTAVGEKANDQSNKDPVAISSSSSSSSSSSQTNIISTNSTSTNVPSSHHNTSAAARNFHRCKDCDAVFSHQKTLREHLCKNAAAAVQCEVCDRVLTSRSSLKLHMQSHEPSRRFKCNNCDYSTSDHNAFRRHKMTHDNNAKMYACAHCDYKSIQSVAYQKHVQQKHPHLADKIVYKCKICPYATINKALYDVHKIKHENLNGKNETPATAIITDSNNVLSGTEKKCNDKNAPNTVTETAAPPKTKIKVKSHLLLTTPVVDSMMEFNDLCFDALTVPV